MTSTLKIDNLVHRAREAAATTPNTIPAEYLIEGTAKARGHWEGSDATLDNSFGLSGLTDNGTGDFSPNLAVSMSNGNWQAVCSCDNTITASSASECKAITYTTADVEIKTGSNGTLSDRDDTVFVGFGDLA